MPAKSLPASASSKARATASSAPTPPVDTDTPPVPVAPVVPFETRVAVGRKLREKTPRGSHAHLGNTDRDIIELLRTSSDGRVGALVPLRYGRMLASPFAFYRGSAIVQAHDLAGTPNTGLTMQICGDCHLANFGGFATPERTLIFDLNDFDETAPGPWEWDLKRLCASLMLAARQFGFGDTLGVEMVRAAVDAYARRLDEYAHMPTIALWHEQVTFERMLGLAQTERVREGVKRGIARATGRTHENVLPKFAQHVGDHWQIRDSPPTVFHVHGATTLFGPEDDWLGLGDWRKLFAPVYKSYVSSLSPDRARMLANYTQEDLAFKVVGVGSVGTRCLVLLMMDTHEQPLFLQFKEASRSVVSRFFRNVTPKHDGRRVVEGQRLMQAASDAFLGWGSGPFGRCIYGRQLRDMKISAQFELFRADGFREYASLCGWVLARAHAKAGGCAAELVGYVGKGVRLGEALSHYATDYADQVERDYEVFRKACRDGRLEARTDADMAADFMA
ncbi:hypothetical protein PHO31112_03816 [Pandoraea horticolens]|uniref:DUF2252 domain-containing protein n=1 Tax=Pandoraea horticolens TaxID=2508298 RepID=A0A5E4XES0_9BURK|nr:DUF2252 domain-containing protein [Pandoraea horticolens]VVE34660.1 hypothetical protein PHO31112_03816 [Pandoraea horticolens]